MARKIAHGLDPIAMEAGGLSVALHRLAQMTGTLSGIDCRLRIPSEVGPLDSPAQINLYRAAQEAVNNALKYSHGQHIWIDLEFDAGVQRLSVSDDGVGIDQDKMACASGLGLRSLRHRASLLGGSCMIGRNASGGTTVAISYPVPQSPGHASDVT